MLLYVSGKYSGSNKQEIDENIAHARKVAIQLWEMGHAVICPHLNTAHFEEDCKVGWSEYIAGDLQMIARCDGIVMLKGWTESTGACEENLYAEKLGIPVFLETVGLPGLHPTEVRSPEQAKAFAEVVGQMYRTHLTKNADYSPANILGSGNIGLATRLWDKISRLMNLVGFNIKVESSEYSEPKSPKNESIEDTLLDAAVYSVIGLLLRRGKWGR